MPIIQRLRRAEIIQASLTSGSARFPWWWKGASEDATQQETADKVAEDCRLESENRRTKAKDAMPKGPKGEKRPADVIGNAIKIARIATGEEEEALTEDGKDKAAVSLGKRGGRAEQKISHERRSDIAQKAAKSRWTKS